MLKGKGIAIFMIMLFVSINPVLAANMADINEENEYIDYMVQNSTGDHSICGLEEFNDTELMEYSNDVCGGSLQGGTNYLKTLHAIILGLVALTLSR